MKKTARLTIETDRIFVIRKRREHPQAMCRPCGNMADFVTADEAASLVGTSSRAIYRLVEAGQLHFAETAEGSLLICLNSLRDAPVGTFLRNLTDSSDGKVDG